MPNFYTKLVRKWTQAKVKKSNQSVTLSSTSSSSLSSGYKSGSDSFEKPKSKKSIKNKVTPPENHLQKHYQNFQVLAVKSESKLILADKINSKEQVIIKQVYKNKANSTAQYLNPNPAKNTKNLPNEIYFSKLAYKHCPQFTLPVLHYSYSPENANTYTMVQPKFGMSLFDFMKSRRKCLTINESKYIFKQVIVALTLLQKHKIFHLDLKEENILINSTTYAIKLIDFDVAHDQKINQNVRVGSPFFISPEVYLGRSCTKNLHKHDVWSLGISLFSSLTGQIPYKNINEIILQEIYKHENSSSYFDLKPILIALAEAEGRNGSMTSSEYSQNFTQIANTDFFTEDKKHLFLCQYFVPSSVQFLDDLPRNQNQVRLVVERRQFDDLLEVFNLCWMVDYKNRGTLRDLLKCRFFRE